ncbi:MAG: hypothetical protein ABIO70_20705 [Pseudomonadota bacterium]
MLARSLLPLCLAGFTLALAAAPARAGCTKDTDCKGARICNPEGRCVDPTPCPPCPCVETHAPPPAPPPAPVPAPAVPPGPDALVITMSGDAPVTGIEVVCPGGFRQRVSFEERVATVAGVPAEACSINFKGPTSARYQPVRGGQSLTCHLQGTTAVCE